MFVVDVVLVVEGESEEAVLEYHANLRRDPVTNRMHDIRTSKASAAVQARWVVREQDKEDAVRQRLRQHR